jgi:hypothetical protein
MLYGRGGGDGRGLGVGPCLGVGVGRGVVVGVDDAVAVAVAVGLTLGVGLGVPPPVTVTVTGTLIRGRTGSLLPTQTVALYVPTVSSLASTSTFTSSLSAGGILPPAGLTEIQGTSVGGTQGAPEAIARAVC